jgi:hypothetical protein
MKRGLTLSLTRQRRVSFRVNPEIELISPTIKFESLDTVRVLSENCCRLGVVTDLEVMKRSSELSSIFVCCMQ